MENTLTTTNIRVAMNIKQTLLVSKQESLLKLIRLVSPALPIGGYSYSQGLESAVAHSWVHNEPTTLDWIHGLLNHSLMNLDIPVLQQFYRAWQDYQWNKIFYWNQFILASRDAFEFQEEDRQLGKALARLLVDLDLKEAETLLREGNNSFLSSYSLAGVRWNIPLKDLAIGFLWIWAENQILAAIKLIPLGQTAGQKILSDLIETIPETVNQGLALKEHEIGYTAPAHSIAGALHETQYARLFRS